MYYKQCGRTIVLVHCVAYYHISDYKFSYFLHITAPSLIVIFLKAVTVISFLPQCQVMSSKKGKKITPLNYKGSYKYINLHSS